MNEKQQIKALEKEIKELKKEQQQKETIFDDNLDVKKFALEVHSDLKKHITPDFTMAQLSDKDKTFITEMVQNAHFNKSILDQIVERMEIKIDQTKDKNIIEKLRKEKKKIKEISNQLFNEYILKSQMIAILGRNDKNNWLLKQALKGEEEQEQQEEQETQNGLLTGIKNLLKKDKEKSED